MQWDRRTILLAGGAAIATLGACAARGISVPEGESVPTGSAYFAAGAGPVWTVEITEARLLFIGADGRRISVPNPGARPSFYGERYVTDRLTIDITHVECTDEQGRRYPDRVMVETGTASLRGCGGARIAPASLDRTAWRIISISGAPLVAGSRSAFLRFHGARLSGSAGCNALSGRFVSDGTTLTVSEIAGTRMACAEPLMAQENALLALLGQPLTIQHQRGGRLRLTAADGRDILLERQN